MPMAKTKNLMIVVRPEDSASQQQTPPCFARRPPSARCAPALSRSATGSLAGLAVTLCCVLISSSSSRIPEPLPEPANHYRNAEVMSNETPEVSTQPVHIEVSPALLGKLHTIANSEAFAVNATLESAFTHVKALVMEILNAPAAYPAWRIDDLEEQLASARRIADRLATHAPRPSWGDKISDPPIYDGNRDTLEGFMAQLRLKLFSDPTRFPMPSIWMAYTFNRLQGRAQAQVLPFIKGNTIHLKDAEDIVQILHNAFGDTGPATTARAKLTNLRQGKKEFNTYFAEFQMLVSKLNWNKDAKLDALREGMSHDLRCLLLGRTKNLTFNVLVVLCQETDTESGAINLSKGRSYLHSRNHQGHTHSRAPTTSPLATTPAISPVPSGSGNRHSLHPDAMDLSATRGRGKISEEERAARLLEGRCLYCSGVEYMGRHCPNKTKNPFHAASAHMEGNPNIVTNPNPDPFANPNPNTSANHFSGGGGGGNKEGGGTSGQGQSANA